MAQQFLVPIDLNGLELLNFLAQKLATAPTHSEGRVYYDTTLHKLRIAVAAGAWETLGESTSGMTSEQVQDIVGTMVVQSGLIQVTYDDNAGTLTIATTATANSSDATLLARANHTGTQLASTISDFNTAALAAVPASSTTVVGKVELADSTETQTMTDTARAVTPSGLAAASVSAPTVNRIIRRDASGRAQVVDPSVAADIATKNYVDGRTGAASETVSGIVELATAAETTTGTDTTRAVHPAGLKVELDKKSGTAHTHTASQVTDFTTSVQSLVNVAIAALVDSSPTALDTLNELAAALGDDPNFAATMTTALGTKIETFAATVGNGVATSYAVTHSFGTRNVNVQVFQSGTPWANVVAEVRLTDTNTVTVLFGVAPTTDQYTVVVQG